MVAPRNGQEANSPVTERPRQRRGRAEWFRERRGRYAGRRWVTNLSDLTSETTDDPVVADTRNFYKVELWTRDDRIERYQSNSAPRLHHGQTPR
jgi:hypothetical protein